MSTQPQNPTMNYMLRKSLIPWRIDDTIHEVLDYCRANHVGEVMWKINAEAFNEGLTSLATIKSFIPHLKKAKAIFDRHSIKTSINPWVTLNHADYGRDCTAVFPTMQWMVDFTGATAKAVPCPLSKTWQEYITAAYALYAEVKPNILWVEDDFRNFNHGTVEWGCFCPQHLDLFAKTVGRPISREELVSLILQPGTPHPTRIAWMEFLGAIMVNAAQMIGQAVYSVSPKTSLALMCADPDCHSIEGRQWRQILAAFSMDKKPIVRPHCMPYRHQSMLDIYTVLDGVRVTAHCLPPATRLCPEIENAPFTQYVKSVAFTRLQLLLSVAAGNADTTLNLYDHVGSPLPPDDPYGLMLRAIKLYADGLLKYCRPDAVQRGIRLIFSPDIACHVRTTNGASFEELFANPHGWSMPLQAMGHPVTFHDVPVAALTGQASRGLNREQTLELLSRGVLLDASAVITLTEDGFGEFIGAKDRGYTTKNNVTIAAEQIFSGEYVSHRLATSIEIVHKFEMAKDASAASTFIDYRRNLFSPAMVHFENSLGGRVASYAINFQHGATCCFLSWLRNKQLKHTLRWLSRDRLDLHVGPGPYSIPLRLDYENYSIIAVANNSPDAWPHIVLEFNTDSRSISEILTIDEVGRWSKAPVSEITVQNHIAFVKINRSLSYLDLAVICVNYK